MIENYLWQYLVLFSQTEKITLVAKEMNVTPASVSRGLKKLEEQLGLRLFDRKPQDLRLTSVGKYLAKKAAELLKHQDQMLREVKNYAEQQAQLKFGSTLKGAMLLAEELFDDQVAFSAKYILPSEVEAKLFKRENSLIFTSKRLETEKIATTYLGNESLAIKVTALNPLYEKKTVKFADLTGHKFVVAENLGIWGTILEENTHDALFLPQNSLALAEITQHSNFPIFKTNITAYLDKMQDEKRKLIPLIDKTAQIPIYAVYLKENEALVKDKIIKMQKILTDLNFKSINNKRAHHA